MHPDTTTHAVRYSVSSQIATRWVRRLGMSDADVIRRR